MWEGPLSRSSLRTHLVALLSRLWFSAPGVSTTASTLWAPSLGNINLNHI